MLWLPADSTGSHQANGWQARCERAAHRGSAANSKGPLAREPQLGTGGLLCPTPSCHLPFVRPCHLACSFQDKDEGRIAYVQLSSCGFCRVRLQPHPSRMYARTSAPCTIAQCMYIRIIPNGAIDIFILAATSNDGSLWTPRIASDAQQRLG
jgi:hypothetical protein